MTRTLLYLCSIISLAAAGPVVTEEELCNICSNAVMDLEAAVTDEKLHAKVMDSLGEVCHLVTPERSEECHDVISGLSQEVLYHLLKDMKPMDLCSAMTACPAGIDIQTQNLPREDRVGENNLTCALCEFLVQTIDSWLKNETTPAQANATAYAVCDILPETLRDTCLTFAPLITDMLIDGVDPVGACTNLGVCLDVPEPISQFKPQPLVKKDEQLPSADPACELCELLVQTVDQYLQENQTIAAINSTIYEICNDLPATLNDTCLEFAPKLVVALAKGVDPKQACTEIGLCSSTESAVSQRHTKMSFPSAGPECVLCELLVQNLDQYLKENQTIAAINSTIYEICNDLPATLNDSCLEFAPKLVAALAKGVDPKQACTEIGLCSSTESAVSQRHTKMSLPSAGPECVLCELLVQNLDQYLKENQTIAAINSTIYEICNDLPATLNDSCLEFAPKLVAALAKGVDPKQACTEIGLCSSTESAVSQRHTKMSFPSAGPECVLCELLVQNLDQYLKENQTIAAINSTIYEICNDLPATLNDSCLEFAPKLVAALAKGVDPKQACTEIGLCSSTESAVYQRHTKMSLPSAGPGCELCELLVQTVDQYLKDNKTEAAINATVYNFCNDLPAILKDTCLTYAPQLVTTLAKGVDPEKACADIGLCSSTESRISVRRVDIPLPSADPACQLCELLVQTIDQYLNESQTKAAINVTVYNFCNDLPSPLNETCLGFAPQLVTDLVNGVDPKKACTSIGLCSSTVSRVSQRHMDISLPSADPACQLCELLVQTIDQYLNESQTKAAINATVYNFCNDLPSPLNGTCLGFAPQLVTDLVNGVDPKKACTSIGLCSSTVSRVSQRHMDISLPSADPACQLCELLVQTIDQYLNESQTKAAINATVYNFCNDLPSPLNGTCLGFAPQLVTDLVNGVDPKKACTSIGLCSSTVSRVSQRHVDISLPSADPACQLCELLVQTIDQYLNESQTKAAINATVYNFCNDLPSPLNGTCLGFAPQLVTDLANGVDPKKACTSIGLCSSTESWVSPRQVAISLPAAAGPACELCELIVQYLDQNIKENKTAINGTVYTLCNDLPEAARDMCLTYAPMLVTVLSNGVDPTQACTAVKLCTSADEDNRSVFKRDIELPSAGPIECELCELLIRTVDQYLKDNKTPEAAINTTVYNLCNDLPATLKNSCLSFAPKLVSALSKGVDPKQACTELKLCTSKAAQTAGLLSNVLLNPRAVAPMDDMWCTICKDHMEILIQDLYREETPVLHFIEGICHRLPPPTDKACLDTADTKFPEIWEGLLNGTASPDSICKLLTICPKQTVLF